ncbi:MAG: TIGR04141 family sporadically distributed protein [Deltaproteobacteria bacterium]|nr:TIGR04141 family sporadically distributed protein [Deltaproteobacteria bacterium]
MITLQVKAYVVPSTLPAFNYGLYSVEEDYNEAVALAQPDYPLLDQNLVYYRGQDKVEVCDLFGVDKRFIHVKRWSSSAALSHLFNQGEVPARLLIHSEEFRNKVIAKLTGPHATLITSDGIKPSEFTVVFAVTSESAKSLHESLPLFSRMTFVRIASTLQTYGYKVELMKINVLQPAAVASTAMPVASASTLAPAASP